MISPTGQGIRNDPEGSGEYGALRGDRLHNGVDFLCEPEHCVMAPFDMVIKRVSYPHEDHVMSGIAWVCRESSGRLWYFEPDQELIGCKVYQGDVIGFAQDISKYYNAPKMKPHLHFRITR